MKFYTDLVSACGTVQKHIFLVLKSVITKEAHFFLLHKIQHLKINMKYVKIKTAYACVRFIIIIKTKSWDRELKVASPPSTLMTCNVY